MQWLEVYSTQTNELQLLAKELGIHPLALEDCFHRNQKAKLEDYETHQFLVWFLYTHTKIYELQFLLFPEKIVFVPHDPPPDGSKTWKEYFHLSDDKLRDVPHALFQALDLSTDQSFLELQSLINKMDAFEQKLFKGTAEFKTILPIKKKLATLEMQMGPLPLLAQQIQNLLQVKNDLRWRFRDLRDHCERFHDSLTFQQTQLVSSVNLHWAMAAQRTNLQMKKLTLLASVSVPLTFWASFWGMNFEFIPYKNPYFFAAAMIVMLGTAIGTYLFLKYRGYWSDQ
jgi:magnesium transporter